MCHIEGLVETRPSAGQIPAHPEEGRGGKGREGEGRGGEGGVLTQGKSWTSLESATMPVTMTHVDLIARPCWTAPTGSFRENKDIQ